MRPVEHRANRALLGACRGAPGNRSSIVGARRQFAPSGQGPAVALSSARRSPSVTTGHQRSPKQPSNGDLPWWIVLRFPRFYAGFLTVGFGARRLRGLRNQEVGGSIPPRSTNLHGEPKIDHVRPARRKQRQRAPRRPERPASPTRPLGCPTRCPTSRPSCRSRRFRPLYRRRR